MKPFLLLGFLLAVCGTVLGTGTIDLGMRQNAVFVGPASPEMQAALARLSNLVDDLSREADIVVLNGSVGSEQIFNLREGELLQSLQSARALVVHSLQSERAREFLKKATGIEFEGNHRALVVENPGAGPFGSQVRYLKGNNERGTVNELEAVLF